MAKVVIPAGYKTPLPVYETQCAIEFIKKNFQENLCNALNLRRVSAPLFVEEASGLNDNLNGFERPVSFDVPDVGADSVVVHSLAKWKRLALKRYGFHHGVGLYTDMNAIRRDEELDNIHSVYVDQWDWEKIISREERTPEYIIDTVQRIVNCVYVTNEMLKIQFPQLKTNLSRELVVITSQELADRYPELESGSARETAFLKENKDKAVFLMQIGGKLRSGKPHDGRAPDYDDWTLNGDILYWNDVLQRSFEISSMGIRVDEAAMARQLELSGCQSRAELPFHKALLAGELPLTIGGGIGQSRLCMLMMGCAHIGEVQCSIWDEMTRTTCENAGIMLL
ncbi:MAG: aspartate--ammonia ligase [Oscillospiraceae bacterium]|nr:aspartate--ammonia ligase [Oscillospiraceae bacterium]